VPFCSTVEIIAHVFEFKLKAHEAQKKAETFYPMRIRAQPY
jgi:hypothetical protein